RKVEVAPLAGPPMKAQEVAGREGVGPEIPARAVPSRQARPFGEGEHQIAALVDLGHRSIMSQARGRRARVSPWRGARREAGTARLRRSAGSTGSTRRARRARG